MRLSMWILAEELSAFDIETDIKDGQMCIETLRICTDEPPRGISGKYVCLCEEDGRIDLMNGIDRITMRGVRTIDLVNILLQIFEDYQSWSGRMTEAAAGETPLQTVMDIAHEKFLSPMLFGNINRQILAITGQYTDDQVYDGWSEVVRKCTITDGLAQRVNASDHARNFPGDEAPQGIEPVWDWMHFAHQVRTNCYLNHSIWGHLYLYRYEENVSPAVLQKADCVAKIYEKIIAEHEADTPPRYSQYSWLIDVIRGGEFHIDPIISLYQQRGWKHSDPLVIMRIESADDGYSDRFLFHWMCTAISERIGQTVFPIGGETVVVIAPAEEKILDRVTEQLGKIIRSHNYLCGVSLPFVGMKGIASYYWQAGFALRRPSDEGCIRRFRDCLLEGMMMHYQHFTDEWKSMITPKLFTLFRGDEYGRLKGLYTSLREYLRHNNNLAETSKHMHIHRNTLAYRLKKVEEELGVEIDTPDNRTYLLNSIALLENAKTGVQ